MNHPIDIDNVRRNIETATTQGIQQIALFLLCAYSDLWKIHAAGQRKGAGNE